jgi:hypothetical protein
MEGGAACDWNRLLLRFWPELQFGVRVVALLPLEVLLPRIHRGARPYRESSLLLPPGRKPAPRPLDTAHGRGGGWSAGNDRTLCE